MKGGFGTVPCPVAQFSCRESINERWKITWKDGWSLELQTECGVNSEAAITGGRVGVGAQQIFNDWGNMEWNAAIRLEFDFFGPRLTKQITCSM